MVFKQLFFFQNTLLARETPQTPFMANAILDFHFVFWNPSLIVMGAPEGENAIYGYTLNWKPKKICPHGSKTSNDMTRGSVSFIGPESDHCLPLI